MTKGLREGLGSMLENREIAAQVGALCLDAKTGKVLLITSRGTGRWIIPKGWPIEGLSNAASALQEAWEEAGVRGEVGEATIGSYGYDKIPNRGGAGIPVHVDVYHVQVRDLAKDYPESSQRQRKWFNPRKAADLVAEPALKALLRSIG